MDELQHRVEGDLAAGAHRDVVDEDRERRRGGDGGEVGGDSALGRAVVVRRDGENPGRPGLGSHPRELDGVSRVVGPRAGDHRHRDGARHGRPEL
jgi:hypothetical protein